MSTHADPEIPLQLSQSFSFFIETLLEIKKIKKIEKKINIV